MLFLEGNIGAGKSSFLQILKDHLDCQVIFEPHNRWQGIDGEGNMLDLFYKNPKRWAYTFETYTLLTRLLDHQIHITKQKTGFVISERSPYSGKYCFAANTRDQGYLSDIEWSLYQSLCHHLFAEHVAQPTGIIYLRTNPEICHQRLKMRNRSEETSISLEYLQRIHSKHEDWLLNSKETPVLVLDGNLPYLSNQKSRESLVNSVSQFFGIANQSENSLGSLEA